MQKLTEEQRLNGLKQAYAEIPSAADIANPSQNTMVWLSKVKVLINGTGKSINTEIQDIQRYHGKGASISTWSNQGYNDIKQTLIDVIVGIEMIVGSQVVVAGPGNVFDYFDGTRKILKSAQNEIFLIDPWVDAEIVSVYFNAIEPPVNIRILTSNKPSGLNSIQPALEKLHQQTSVSFELRSVDTNDRLHDRFWLIDQRQGFQSSCSIKDGAKKAAAMIMQINDAFSATQQTYEDFWNNGSIRLKL